MPLAKTPVEFVRELTNGNEQLAGNKVQLEDENGDPFNNGNPLPISNGGFPVSLGQKIMPESFPVVIASDQSDVSIRSGQLPSNVGQTTMVGSLSVVVASDQTAIKTSDSGPSWTSVFGISSARFTSANQSAAPANISDAPTASQKIVIADIVVSVDTAMRVDIKEETSGTVIFSLYMPANGTVQITPRGKIKLATIDKKLTVQTSASGNIAVTATYYSEA